MANYQRRPDIWQACQWTGHGGDFDLDVEITKKEGITGYAAKLGYYQNETNMMKTVRPNDYVIIQPDGKIITMIAEKFEAEFVLAKETKPVNTKVSKQSNKSEDNS